MATHSQNLTPAKDLASKNKAHTPNESEDYRRARNALLAKEIEVRRALPPGGEVKKDYKFVGEKGPISFTELFGDKHTLIIYNYLFGPERERPCPMCTALMDTWDGMVKDVEQRASMVMVARSPIERLVAFKKERGWRALKLFTDSTGDYTRDYVDAEDRDIPGYSVFTRRDGKIRHFYSGEMSGEMADPGQDPRGAPDLMPLWNILDTTPEGRGQKWYPKLEYGPKA
jgi:predicted dithiol-disulfide oxidoreductase (DUF899 family)